MKKKYSERLKDFLESGTPNAKVAQVALCVLALASVPVLVFVAAAMGNAVQIFRQFETSKRFKANQIRRAMNYLRQQKLIEYVGNSKGKTVVRITKKGKSRLREFDIEFMKVPKQKKWDGKWRLVMYDLPIRFQKVREELRWKLKDLGFYRFQKSAWIYPYPCDDEIIFIADFYGVGNFVDILTVESILREEKIREHFSLK